MFGENEQDFVIIMNLYKKSHKDMNNVKFGTVKI